MGLAAALECAYFGVPAMLVERHSGTTWHPKARNLNSRTMEIMRRLGLEPELQAVGLPEAWTRQIVYADTLSGAELGRMGTGGFESRSSAASPCAAVLSSQDVFEPIWRGRAEQQPLLDVRYGHQAEILDVDAAGAVVRLTGARGGDVRARYLLAADGAGGAIRQGLGIGLEGPENLGHFINVYYRANLDRVVAHRPAVLYFTANEAGRGVFQPLDGRKRWLSQIAYDGAADTRAGFDGKRCAQWIRNAAGEPDLKVEIQCNDGGLQTYTKFISDYGYTGALEWQEYTIPICDFFPGGTCSSKRPSSSDSVGRASRTRGSRSLAYLTGP